MEYEEGFPRFSISDDIYKVWVKDHQPYIATFELTPCCNFRCIHCYLGVHREEKQALSYDQVTHILDELKEAGVLQIALTGGECMMRKDFADIYLYAKRSGFLVTVFSNLSLLTDEILKCFSEYPPFSVEVSLYGASEETYESITGKRAFQQVLNNLQKLKEKDIHFSLKTPLILQNSKDEAALEKIAESFGKKLRIGFAMSPTIDCELYPTSFALDLETRFRHELSNAVNQEIGLNEADIENPWGEQLDSGAFAPQFICNPGVNDVFVDYMGNVLPCVAYRSKGKSLLSSSFSDIWESFRYFKSIPALPGNKCVRCDSRYFCSICVGEQDELYHDMCRIPHDVCIYAQARKKLYKDKEDPDAILTFIRENELKNGIE